MIVVIVMITIFLPVWIEIEAINSGGLIVVRLWCLTRVWSAGRAWLRRRSTAWVSMVVPVDTVVSMDIDEVVGMAE